MTGDRRRRLVLGGAVAPALLIALGPGRLSAAVLYLCALASCALVVNLHGSRQLFVQWLFSAMHGRRPDLTWERLNAYVIGWSVVVIAGFLLVLPRLFRGP